MIYASDSLALATLEKWVNIKNIPLKSRYVYFRVEGPFPFQFDARL